MAEIQEYHSPNGFYASPQQHPPVFGRSYNRSIPVSYPDNLAAEVSMARPILQSPFRPEEHMQHLQWPPPQNSMSSSMMSTRSQTWGQFPASSTCIDFTGLPGDPFIITETDRSMLANNELVYNHTANDFYGLSSWVPDALIDVLPSNTSAPSPSADVVLSPLSPFSVSDAKHTYTPGPDCSPATPNRGSASYTMSKVSLSPAMLPPTPQSVIRPQSLGSTVIQHALPMTPGSAFEMGSTMELADAATMFDSEHSYAPSQSNSPGSTPWFPPGYKSEKAAIQRSQQQPPDSMPYDRRPNSFLAPLDRNSRQRQAQWSNKSPVPAQNHFQARFISPLTADEKAMKSKEDKTLIRMKEEGYTYKDIRKALGCKVAESTLRGRYRSLTKPKENRVRAPKWTETDVMLLKRFVQDEFDKLDVTQPSLERKQKPDKVPWMRIVESIAANGGSYKFGAATAKKKWIEVSRPAPIRSSRRRSRA